MNDEKVVPGRVAILDKSGEPMTPTEGEAVPIDRKARRDPRNRMQDYATREEMMDGVAAGVKAVADLMYEQVSGEIDEYLKEEFAKLEARLEARTLRGRMRTLLGKLRRKR